MGLAEALGVGPGVTSVIGSGGKTTLLAALARELRRMNVSVIDVRPPHTETGLATRPLAGQAPRLPQGLAPEAVARRIVQAIEDGQSEVPAADFSPS